MSDYYQPPVQRELQEISHTILQTYRVAVALGFSSIAVGFVIAIVTGDPVSNELGSYGAVGRNLLDLAPEGFFGLGIGIIILAPIVMLLRSLAGFWKIHDTFYLRIAAFVAVILIVSTLLSFAE